MEQTHNYSYERIKELCQEHFQEIAEREDIAYVLNNKCVRYVDPDCHFGYAKFGDFYFNRRGAMMLVTKDYPIAIYHRLDRLENSLWSTVPVFFAGIETGLCDCHGQMIYSGDVLRILDPYDVEGTVTWFPFSDLPLVRLDNHCVYFDQIKRCEIIGNVFYDISTMDWDYGGYPHFISRNAFFQCYVPQEMWDEFQRNIRKGPNFSEGKPETFDKHSMIYGKSFSDVGLREGDRVVAFCCEGESDPDIEIDSMELYIDSYLHGEDDGHYCETIPIDLLHPDYDKIKARIDEIIMKAHNDPGRRYFLYDMKEYVTNKKMYNLLASMFDDVKEYNIRNFVMPFDIAMHL